MVKKCRYCKEIKPCKKEYELDLNYHYNYLLAHWICKDCFEYNEELRKKRIEKFKKRQEKIEKEMLKKFIKGRDKFLKSRKK